MEFTPLPPELIRELLSGHESLIPDIAKKNDAAKDAVRGTTCKECGTGLLPRPHPKPEVLFKSEALTYVGYCPFCRKTTGT
jgi:hypothetical protein